MINGTLELSWSIDPFRDPIGGFQALTWAIGTTDDTVILVLDGAPTGLAGTLTVQIVTQDTGTVVYPASTLGIVETPAGTGRYTVTVPVPANGAYFVVWTDGVTTVQTELLVFSDAVVQPPLHALTDGRYEAKTGDLEPSLIATLVNSDLTPIDLTAAGSVTVRVRHHHGDILVERVGTVLDAEGGEVMFAWQDGEQDTAGIYDAEWIINLLDGRTATVPSRGAYRFTRYDTLTVIPSNRWTLN